MFLAHLAHHLRGLDLEGLLAVAIVAMMLLMSILPRRKVPQGKRKSN